MPTLLGLLAFDAHHKATIKSAIADCSSKVISSKNLHGAEEGVRQMQYLVIYLLHDQRAISE